MVCARPVFLSNDGRAEEKRALVVPSRYPPDPQRKHCLLCSLPVRVPLQHLHGRDQNVNTLPIVVSEKAVNRPDHFPDHA